MDSEHLLMALIEKEEGLVLNAIEINPDDFLHEV